MKEFKNNIKCPNCSEIINVNEILYHELELKHKQKYLIEQKKLQEELKEQRNQHKYAMQELKNKEEEINNLIEEKLQKKLKLEKLNLTQQIKKQLHEEQQEAITCLQEELNEKSLKIKELNEAKVLIQQLKRKNEEEKTKLISDNEKKLNEILSEEMQKFKKIEDEKNELRFKQQQNLIENLKKELQNTQRKAELGSQQLQGETQEIAIEEFLKTTFVLDNIEEIKKGVRGADCIQTIHTRIMQNCGKICYESKRAKEFQKSWIEKFKDDLRENNCDIGVLVTEVMPKEMQRFGMFDGIWICSFEEFKALSHVLRDSLIKISNIKKTQENKSDKMQLLYNYLISNEFKMQVEAIVEGFSSMQKDLDSEKRAMQRIWKQREKQIQKVLDNTINMYANMKAIAGNVIQDIKLLEL